MGMADICTTLPTTVLAGVMPSTKFLILPLIIVCESIAAKLPLSLKCCHISSACFLVMPMKPRAESGARSEENTSELQSLMRTSYAAFCFKKTNTNHYHHPKPPTQHQTTPHKKPTQ